MNLLKTFLIVMLLQGSIAYSQIGIQTNTPDPSSALDIVSTTKGLLIPRVTLTNSLANPSPVTAPATGLMVFNSGANQPVGFYYWNGSAWVPVTGAATNNSWLLLGNAGTVDGTNFVGTTDNVPLNFKVNSQKAGRISQAGMTFLGYQAGNANTSTNSTGFGYQALNANIGGANNTAVGYQALNTNTTGTNNTAIGANAKTNANNLSNTTALGYNAMATASNQVRLGDNNVQSLYCMGAYNSASPNIPNLYVDANGQIMRSVNVPGWPGWLLSGNAGTTVGTNFIGTTDDVSFAINTNNTERMRFLNNGQSIIGRTTPYFASDFVTIEGNATQNYALKVLSPYIGVYSDATNYGVYGKSDLVGLRGRGGVYGVYATGTGVGVFGGTSANAGSGGWFQNDTLPTAIGEGSYGAFFVGSGIGFGYSLQNHSAGMSSAGNDGIFAAGKASAGFGIIAGGNGISTFSTLNTGGGGAFTGYHGVYGTAINSQGTGIIGVGNNYGSYYTYDDGSGHLGGGGAFTGTYNGVAGYASQNSNSSIAVYGRYNGGGDRNAIGVYGYSRPANNYGYGVYGIGNKYGVVGYEGTTGNNNYGLYAIGDVGATGNKNFVIDHPLDPENKILKHTSIESPEVLNMYRGNIVLDNLGEAAVQLPDYFMAININFSYDLTPIGQKAPDLYIKNEINEEGEFEISGGNPGQKVSWVVYAERNDLYMRQDGIRVVEVEKDESEKGKYLMPELYNQPPEKGIFYNSINNQERSPEQMNTIQVESQEVKAVEVKEQLKPKNETEKINDEPQNEINK